MFIVGVIVGYCLTGWGEGTVYSTGTLVGASLGGIVGALLGCLGRRQTQTVPQWSSKPGSKDKGSVQ